MRLHPRLVKFGWSKAFWLKPLRLLIALLWRLQLLLSRLLPLIGKLLPPFLHLHYGVKGFDDGRFSVVAEVVTHLLRLPLVAYQGADCLLVIKIFLFHQVLKFEALLSCAFGEMIL